jgi:hypothetical protein
MADDRVIVFQNGDKKDKSRENHPLLPPWPFRALIVGAPNSGKTNCALNLIAKIEPEPGVYYIIHGDPESKDYELLRDAVTVDPDEMDLSFIDEMAEREPKTRILVIIDEVGIADLEAKKRKEFRQLFMHKSSHKNCSVIMVYQDFNLVPMSIKKMCDVYVFCGKVVEKHIRRIFANMSGISKDEFEELESLKRSNYDSIWIDKFLEPDDKYKFRLNLWNPVIRRKVMWE